MSSNKKNNVLFDEVQPEDLDSNYFYEYLKENKEHIKMLLIQKLI